ncbi:MAG: hypothetical protein HYY62_08800 [Deltaproteobacteria bacterium]|nr:hypothetical protein [Deltaproteobacteria bacterium]
MEKPKDINRDYLAQELLLKMFEEEMKKHPALGAYYIQGKDKKLYSRALKDVENATKDAKPMLSADLEKYYQKIITSLLSLKSEYLKEDPKLAAWLTKQTTDEMKREKQKKSMAQATKQALLEVFAQEISEYPPLAKFLQETDKEHFKSALADVESEVKRAEAARGMWISGGFYSGEMIVEVSEITPIATQTIRGKKDKYSELLEAPTSQVVEIFIDGRKLLQEDIDLTREALAEVFKEDLAKYPQLPPLLGNMEEEPFKRAAEDVYRGLLKEVQIRRKMGFGTTVLESYERKITALRVIQNKKEEYIKNIKSLKDIYYPRTLASDSYPKPSQMKPTEGDWGQKMILMGKNLEYVKEVTFKGDKKAPVPEYQKDSGNLTIIVPEEAQSGPVTLHFTGGSVQTSESFNVILPPTIDNGQTWPREGASEETVEFRGTNLKRVTKVIFFKNKETPFTLTNSGSLKATVPQDVEPGRVSFYYIHSDGSEKATVSDSLSFYSGQCDNENIHKAFKLVLERRPKGYGKQLQCKPSLYGREPISLKRALAVALKEPVSGTLSSRKPPVLSGFSPAEGRVGGDITLRGSNFAYVEKVEFIARNSYFANFDIISNSEITATLPKEMTNYEHGPMEVIIRLHGANVFSFSPVYADIVSRLIAHWPPKINGLSTNEWKPGVEVTIYGEHLLPTSSVTLSGKEISKFTSQKNTELKFVLREEDRSGEVVITTPYGRVSTAAKMTLDPIITSIDPSQGQESVTKTITLKGDYFIDVKEVKFFKQDAIGGIQIAPAFQTISEKELSVTLPAKISGMHAIRVTTAHGENYNLRNYNIAEKAVPKIRIASAEFADQGEKIILYGENLRNIEKVVFKLAKSPHSEHISAYGPHIDPPDVGYIGDEDRLDVTVPTIPADTYTIHIFTKEGEGRLSKNFEVRNALRPKITKVEPTSIKLGGRIKIFGKNISDTATKVSFIKDGQRYRFLRSSADYVHISPHELEIKNIGYMMSPGTYSIDISTTNGFSEDWKGITIGKTEPPEISSISPQDRQLGKPAEIEGRNFINQDHIASVKVGGTSVNAFVESDSKIILKDIRWGMEDDHVYQTVTVRTRAGDEASKPLISPKEPVIKNFEGHKEYCFPGVGNGCLGFGEDDKMTEEEKKNSTHPVWGLVIAGCSKEESGGKKRCWVVPGSIKHDNCCLRHPLGKRCGGTFPDGRKARGGFGLDDGPNDENCHQEWDDAFWDVKNRRGFIMEFNSNEPADLTPIPSDRYTKVKGVNSYYSSTGEVNASNVCADNKASLSARHGTFYDAKFCCSGYGQEKWFAGVENWVECQDPPSSSGARSRQVSSISVRGENKAIQASAPPAGLDPLDLLPKDQADKIRANMKAEEEAKQQKSQEELAKKKSEEEALAKKKTEEEQAKKLAEEAAAKKKSDEELAQKKAQEELAKKKAEETAKKAQEEIAKKQKEQEELARKKTEEEHLAKKKADEELAKKQAEEEVARQKAIEEATKQRQQEEAMKKQREIEKARVPAEQKPAEQKAEEKKYCDPELPRFWQKGCIERGSEVKTETRAPASQPQTQQPQPSSTEAQPTAPTQQPAAKICDPNVPRYSQPGCVEQ